MNVNVFLTVFLCYSCISVRNCLADDSPVSDMCPTNTPGQDIPFINGFVCKNPSSVVASDFKTSKLNHAGDTDSFLHSSMTVLTAVDFVGLNTLGIAFARTDLGAEGIVLPHSHPRASELVFVSNGVVIAGFFDTENRLFQKKLQQGDVSVFPRGLLHFCLNTGPELATIFSVLNSQNPGVVKITDALFSMDSDETQKLLHRLVGLSAVDADHAVNLTAGVNHLIS